MTDVVFPYPAPPAPGHWLEVAPGLRWLRLPLPFRLDHVNVYLIEDRGGWALVDTGVADQRTRDIFTAVLSELGPRPLTRIIATHHHPDHIGLAGWLAARYYSPLFTSLTAYLQASLLTAEPTAHAKPAHAAFFRRHGLGQDVVDILVAHLGDYARIVEPPPATLSRLVAGMTIDIGGRAFSVLSADGHAPEQLMLHCAAENLLLAADQVLAGISPNVSVWASEPEDDPLALFLASLRRLRETIDPGALVLPGHRVPFHGLHTRIEQLIHHHEERCAVIAGYCDGTRSVADLLPLVFERTLDDQQLAFAFGEILAHVHFMIGQGRLRWEVGPDEIRRAIRV